MSMLKTNGLDAWGTAVRRRQRGS